MSPLYTLTAYPKEVALRDGAKVTLRPMEKTDADALWRFFLRIPDADRFYLKDDVTSAQVIKAWAQALDYDRALPLLAMVDGQIVADATLHRRRAGARRHIAEIRVVVDPQFRNRGLGTLLVHELVEIAYDAGLDKVVMELAEEAQSDAILAAQRLGFIRVATLPAHSKDLNGKPHDLVILELPLGKYYQWLQF